MICMWSYYMHQFLKMNQSSLCGLPTPQRLNPNESIEPVVEKLIYLEMPAFWDLTT